MNSNENTNRKRKRREWIWIMLMVNIVFFLLLLTIGIVALRVSNGLPEGTDILFIVGKAANVDVSDGEYESWESGKIVNIFKAQYVNGEGEVVVLSQDGSKLIAPGVETEYSFSLYNDGNMAVKYQVDLDFELFIGSELELEDKFPLLVQLVSDTGQYLIGSETNWVNVEDAVITNHLGVLGANSYETFTVYLQWQFESGNDELDTLLGDGASEDGVSITLKINTYAEEHLDPTASGGTLIDGEEASEYGGTYRIFWIILLLANIAVMIFYIAWLLNKKREEW